jgi:hypothetical protein
MTEEQKRREPTKEEVEVALHNAALGYDEDYKKLVREYRQSCDCDDPSLCVIPSHFVNLTSPWKMQHKVELFQEREFDFKDYSDKGIMMHVVPDSQLTRPVSINSLAKVRFGGQHLEQICILSWRYDVLPDGTSRNYTLGINIALKNGKKFMLSDVAQDLGPSPIPKILHFSKAYGHFDVVPIYSGLDTCSRLWIANEMIHMRGGEFVYVTDDKSCETVGLHHRTASKIRQYEYRYEDKPLGDQYRRLSTFLDILLVPGFDCYNYMDFFAVLNSLDPSSIHELLQISGLEVNNPQDFVVQCYQCVHHCQNALSILHCFINNLACMMISPEIKNDRGRVYISTSKIWHEWSYPVCMLGVTDCKWIEENNGKDMTIPISPQRMTWRGRHGTKIPIHTIRFLQPLEEMLRGCECTGGGALQTRTTTPKITTLEMKLPLICEEDEHYKL